jgi:hypothetical protein
MVLIKSHSQMMVSARSANRYLLAILQLHLTHSSLVTNTHTGV